MSSTHLIEDLTTSAFPPATTKFLRALRKNNDRLWFDAHRDEYQAAYVEPAKAFVQAAAPALERIAPGIHAEPRILGSIFRINRDTRFSKDKSPYKDHLDLWFWEGERRMARSGFFLRISPGSVGIGAGSHGFDKDALASFRAAAADPDSGAQLAAVAEELERDGFDIGGERYVRIPRGMDPDGRAARFLRHGALFVHHDEPSKLASDGERLLPACVDVGAVSRPCTAGSSTTCSRRRKNPCDRSGAAGTTCEPRPQPRPPRSVPHGSSRARSSAPSHIGALTELEIVVAHESRGTRASRRWRRQEGRGPPWPKSSTAAAASSTGDRPSSRRADCSAEMKRRRPSSVSVVASA